MKRRGSTFDNNDNDFNIVNSNNNVPSDDDSSYLTEKMQDNSWRRHRNQYFEQRPWFLNKENLGSLVPIQYGPAVKKFNMTFCLELLSWHLLIYWVQKKLGEKVNITFFTVALLSKVIFESAVTEKMSRFTNFGFLLGPGVDLHTVWNPLVLWMWSLWFWGGRVWATRVATIFELAFSFGKHFYTMHCNVVRWPFSEWFTLWNGPKVWKFIILGRNGLRRAKTKTFWIHWKERTHWINVHYEDALGWYEIYLVWSWYQQPFKR